MRVALTIAGSDSVSGAGIQADLKTFAALGVYGVSVITAVTSQSTTGVADVCALPSPMVRSQIEQLVDDVEIFAVKTGMLATAETVDVVAATLGPLGHLNLVVDPVMAATIADRTLLPQDAVSLLKTRLLPLASVVTPNVAEATALSGVCVDSASRAREAARRIADLGARAVVIKGGHLAGAEAVDLLFHEGTFVEFAAPRCPFESVHGTGCTFASAIAARLASGDNIPAAVERAKQYVTGAIERSFVIGRGARILNHFWESPAGGLYS